LIIDDIIDIIIIDIIIDYCHYWLRHLLLFRWWYWLLIFPLPLLLTLFYAITITLISWMTPLRLRLPLRHYWWHTLLAIYCH
jgi:hypothetical protein